MVLCIFSHEYEHLYLWKFPLCFDEYQVSICEPSIWFTWCRKWDVIHPKSVHPINGCYKTSILNFTRVPFSFPISNLFILYNLYGIMQWNTHCIMYTMLWCDFIVYFRYPQNMQDEGNSINAVLCPVSGFPAHACDTLQCAVHSHHRLVKYNRPWMVFLLGLCQRKTGDFCLCPCWIWPDG